MFQPVRLVEMTHLFPRRGISFLEQVPHRPVPSSFDVALSHLRARTVDALRLDVGDHGPPGNKAAAHPPEPGLPPRRSRSTAFCCSSALQRLRYMGSGNTG